MIDCEGEINFHDCLRHIYIVHLKDNRDGHLLFEVEMYLKMGCMVLSITKIPKNLAMMVKL